MRKITPMILVTLLLVSALSSFDFAELEENEVIEDAGARAGADAELVAITNPKETVCPAPPAACRNVMNVGDETTFSAYIQNSGDADITEMTYSVTVYLSDAAGNPGMVAKDLTGADLTWTNNDVICTSAGVCDFTSLAAGDVLGGGKHIMSVSGSPIIWTPIKGLYVIEIIVSADADADSGNDAQQIYVAVEDWFDIQLDLVWDSALEMENGAGTKDWSLTVTANGSDTFDPREVRVRLQTVGAVSAAQTTTITSDAGINSIDGSTTNIWTAGTSMTVDVAENVSTDPSTITTGTRSVLSTWVLSGQLTVDVANTAEASYGLKASLVDYTQYAQWDSCSYTDNATNETYDNFCEESTTKDAYPSTDSSMIEGFATIFNDIRISDISVVQGYNADGSGQGTSRISDSNGGDLNVGASYLHVQVEHRGSEATSSYNWSVDFTVTDPVGGVVSMINATTCEAVEPVYLEYKPLGLGIGEEYQGYACMMIDLNMDGEYTFTADLVNDSKMVDAKPSNNDQTLTLNVRNNAPIITSLDLLNDGDLYFGQDDLLSMSVQVFDVDDPSATNLEIEWSHAGTALPGCERANMQLTCSIFIEIDYIKNFPVSVTVYDAHGGETSKEMDPMIQIWNDGNYAAVTDSGLTLSYSLLYWNDAPFTITATDGAAFTGQTLPGYSGTYDSVGVIDYIPSTTYSAEDVLSQSITVEFDKSNGATSLWYVNNANWALLPGAPTDVDATTGRFDYSIPANSPVLTSGSFVLMGGSLALAVEPTASISGFEAVAGKAGAIILNWDVVGTMLEGDSIDITICETVNCTTAFEIGFASGKTSYTYSGQNTIHGTNYTVSVAVCNEVGCSSPIGTKTVIVDSAVDGAAAATGLTIANGTTWTVSWTASGDQGDVASWNVCYLRQSFTAAEMGETECIGTDSTSISIDISNWSAGTYTYHFTAVPVDALGNTFSAGSMNSIDYQRDADTSNPDDGIIIIVDETSAGIGAFAWGLIGGVIVIAFIAGAFILSRGGSGDEGKDWDY